MKKWICSVCGYVYDEAKEGRPFEELPDNWVCPLCGAPKSAFSPERQEAAERPAPAPLAGHELGEMKELTAGELAALCSNLARGCEKQYKDREAALYTQLAEFFAAARAPEPDAGLDRLIELVERDLGEGYPALKGAAAAEGDRGTQRICVWGEKVTRILEALLKRYRSEGEAFLKDMKVWVCTVCGFVYVGDAAPQLCPVCKVPSWKFELV